MPSQYTKGRKGDSMKIGRKVLESWRRFLSNILIALGAKEYMPAPAPINTIEAILSTLNGGPTGPWVTVEGYHAVSVPIVSSNFVNFTPPNPGGIILKTFFNTATGEVRFYAAKFLNIPEGEREFLFR